MPSLTLRIVVGLAQYRVIEVIAFESPHVNFCCVQVVDHCVIVDHLNGVGVCEVLIEAHKRRNGLLLYSFFNGMQKVIGCELSEVPMPQDTLLEVPGPRGQVGADIPGGQLGFIPALEPHTTESPIHRGVLETELGNNASRVVALALYGRCDPEPAGYSLRTS